MQKGFTLIELLVVVLIIGILAAVAVPQYQKAVVKSRMAEVLSFTRAMQTALESYYLANNSYTTDISQLDLTLPSSVKYHQTSGTDKPGLFIHWAYGGPTRVYCYIHNRYSGIELTMNQGTASTQCISPYQSNGASDVGGEVCKSLGYTKRSNSGTCGAFAGMCQWWKKP